MGRDSEVIRGKTRCKRDRNKEVVFNSESFNARAPDHVAEHVRAAAPE